MSAITINVHSSFIKSAVYNEIKQSLRIEIDDYWYYYYGITRQKVSRFKNATSKGSYFCKFIKGKYSMLKRAVR